MSTSAATQPMTMPADSTPSPAFVPVPGGEQRIVFRGVDWHTYNCLSEAIGEGEHVHLAYDGKDLEIMVTSNIHENLKELVNKIVNAVTLGLDIDYMSCGETT